MKKNKLIVFDTNAILTNPSLLENYKDTTVIAKTVLDELDYRKTKPEHQERSQLALNIIKDKDIRISVSSSSKKTNNNDEKILLDILEDYSLDSFLLVTDDTGMQLRAKTHGIKSLKLFEFLSENSKHESLTSFHKEMFEHLVKNEFDSIVYGEDINFNSFNFYLENGNTPLIEMVRANNKPAIEYLVKFPGIDLDMIDNSKLKMPAFLHASQRRKIDIMRLLIKQGANPYVTSKGKNKGNSAMLIAAWDGALNIVKFLVEQRNLNISINQSENNGFTPLIKATIKGHEHIVSYLLSHGADKYIRDRQDKLALDYAVEGNHSEIIKMLKGF